jgi:hypothetical protein
MTQKQIWMGLAVLAAFLVGIFSAGFFAAFWLLVTGPVEVACLNRDLCVGIEEGRALRNVALTDVGGMSAIHCTRDNASAHDLTLDQIVAGDRCSGPTHYLEFRNQYARTVLRIEEGKVVQIVHYSAIMMAVP